MPPSNTSRKGETTAAGRETEQASPTGASAPTIRWDDSGITNSYANVCNVSSSREEVVLVFGINKAWERTAEEVQVQLTNRVILSPFAAKRLSMLLNNVLQQYESRFGVMNVGGRAQDEPSAPEQT